MYTGTSKYADDFPLRKYKLMQIINHFYHKFITMLLASWGTLILNRFPSFVFSSLSSLYIHFICKRS